MLALVQIKSSRDKKHGQDLDRMPLRPAWNSPLCHIADIRASAGYHSKDIGARASIGSERACLWIRFHTRYISTSIEV